LAPHPHEARWKKKRTRRPRRIVETLKNAVETTQLTPTWADVVDEIFKARNTGVHFEEDSRGTIAHPIGTNTAWEHRFFHLEASRRAVDMALAILETCVTRPKRTHPKLTEWAKLRASAAEGLSQRRNAALASVPQP
jgi:hypothetical protein